MSLVELVVFIVLVGVAVAGVLAAMNMATRASADPMLQKQALAIAEAVMEEVQLQPFTHCDPDDANAGTALNAGGCADTAEGIGPEAAGAPPGAPAPAEARLDPDRPFDNVNDYHGFAMAGVIDVGGGTVIAELAGFNVAVAVAPQALDAIGAAESLLITVTVTGPVGTSVVLHGYRARYAPNALP